MNALAKNAQEKAEAELVERLSKKSQAAVEKARLKAEATEEKARLKAVRDSSKKKNQKKTRGRKGVATRKRKVQSNDAIDYEQLNDEFSDSEEQPKSRVRRRDSITSNETSEQLLQPLVSALTGVFNKVTTSAQVLAQAPTTTPTAYVPPTKAVMLEESQAEHTFRHKQRMDDLEFFKGLNEIKYGQQTPQASDKSATTGHSTERLPPEAPTTPSVRGVVLDDNQLQEAWDLLNSPTSWLKASDKDTVLIEMLGVKGFKDLQFLDQDHKTMLLGKLKVIPSKKFAMTLKF
jgi:hypothetical protein